MVAERDDHPRIHEAHLLAEERGARLDLDRLRITVAGWPALQDVRDVDVGSVQADRREEFVEQLARRPHERLALQVLVAARSLTDEHDVGIGAPDAENETGPRVSERAPVAVADVFAQFDQGFHRLTTTW
jgi:hypothetical protein